jgi:hypothetical protein
MARRAFGAPTQPQNRWRQREPQILGLLPFCPSCENLDRTGWPGADTEVSAIRAAVWQPETGPVLNASLGPISNVVNVARCPAIAEKM